MGTCYIGVSRGGASALCLDVTPLVPFYFIVNNTHTSKCLVDAQEDRALKLLELLTSLEDE